MEKKEFFEKLDLCFDKYLNKFIDDEKKNKLFVFMNMVLEKNKVMNLTAITEPDMFILKHFIDSMELVKILNKEKKDKLKIVDVGTGAGFPGIPLAIFYDKFDFMLCDSLQKRINFINECIEKIDIKNVKTSHMRAEEVNEKSIYREKFDYCLSRGVSKINILLEYMMPFVNVGGKCVMYKMSDCEKEFNDAKKAEKVLGGKFAEKIIYKIIVEEPDRCLMVYDKINKTIGKYPRQGNKVVKEPII